ncbi:hypothetical protein BLNAU_1970 [Blattamonas nauphoetae]|uniref:Uncharacterized protein n=1 Tax=Blattamonas nauphoetae TaxID=2049346 RepID=A0ABQ9YGR3_9EUKA|nr:hypothetical protein BLNAU_1970 [Blattamonas nauphoetae]
MELPPLSKNTGSNTGGIEYMQYLSAGKIVLTDVLFDENVCTSPTASEHVIDFLFYKDIGIDNREFYDCFSTSTPIKVRIPSPPNGFQSFAVRTKLGCPQTFVHDCISVGQTIQENANGDGFDVVLSFEGVFTGTSRKYDVTLEDADGSEFVAKSVSFSRTAGTASVPLNNPSKSYLSPSTTYTLTAVQKSVSQSTSNEFIEGGVAEPDWTWWHHTSNSRADNMVAMSFTTPVGPRLTNIKADLNPSNLNEVKVTVTVSPISKGSITLVVVDSSDPLKTVTIGPFSFTLSSTPTTSSHTVLIHPSDELSYGKTYTVKTLSSSTLIVYHTGQTLTMPDAPPRISEATPTLTGLNKTFVTLSLSGAALPGATDFGIVVKEMEGNAIKNGAQEIPLTGTIGGTIGSTETTCTTSVEIYTKTGTLEYSKKYKIMSLSIVGFSCIVDVTATFEVPDSPGRVEEMMTPKLDGAKTEVSVVVTGAGFTSISAIVVKRGSTKITSTSITIDSTTELTAKFQAGTVESGTELEFEKSYEIESVSGQSEVFLNAGVRFTVPAAGIVASTSTELNATTNEHFKVIVSGKNFVAGTKWNLKLTDRTEEIEVTMSSATTGESSWVKGGGLNEIAFDSSYFIHSITNVSNASDIILSSGISVETPLASTLTNIKAKMNTTHRDEVILTLTSQRIPAGSFTLVVSKTGDIQHPPISITPFPFSISTAPIDSILSLTVIPSGLLSCGETYILQSLSSSSQIVSHSSHTFQVPSLLRSASASLNLSDFDEVFLSLTAFGFPSSTPITLTIVEVDENDEPIGLPFTLTQTPSTTEDSTHILTTRVEAAKLKHAIQFEITQCDITGREIVLDGRVFFRVPSPPILTGVDFSFATTSNTTFHLILKGTDLPVGETFLVSLDGFEEEIEVTFTNTSGGSSAELALGWSDTLQFDTAYSLLSVIRKGESSISIPSTHLTLQTQPRSNPLILYATGSVNSDPKFCGAVDRQCSSVDVAWLIVDAFSAQRVSLVLMKKALLASQLHRPSSRCCSNLGPSDNEKWS